MILNLFDVNLAPAGVNQIPAALRPMFRAATEDWNGRLQALAASHGAAYVDVFSLFDYTDASMINGDRSTTTVAPQALFLMNSDFVVQATKKMAEQLLSEAQDVRSDEERIQELYRRAYGRPATTSEVEKSHAFLSEIERQIEGVESAVARRLQAWQLFCQAIVSASEFVYVR